MHDEISQVARHHRLRGGTRLAGVAADLARPLTVVGSTMPVGQLEVMFRNPEVSCVVVQDEDSDRIGTVMRAGLATALTGRLGYGRAVLERRPVATVTHWAPLVVRPDDLVSAVATRAMERAEEHRYDDVLVAGPTWAAAGTADVMRSLVAALAERSTQDPLTRLPTRAATWHSLARRCDLVRGGGTRVVVVLVDVEAMARLNARHGIATGDAVLAELGARLRHDLPRGCEAGRVDGDRFAVLAVLPAMDDVHAAASADRLRRHVLSRLEHAPADLVPGAWPRLRSAVVWSPEGAGDPDLLVTEAEALLTGGDDLTTRRSTATAPDTATATATVVAAPRNRQPAPAPVDRTPPPGRTFSDSVRVEAGPGGATSLPSRRSR